MPERARRPCPPQFAAMTRLDHNRAVAQVAAKAGAPVTSVTNLSIWGNHSATQYPDIFHAKVDGQPALDRVGGPKWVEDYLLPTVQQRGRPSSRPGARPARRRPPTPLSTP